MQHIFLRKGEERRLIQGHPWIFSNELLDVPKTLKAGDLVSLFSFKHSLLGVGFFNPHSLIAFRLLSREAIELDLSFFETRLRRAKALRDVLYPAQDTTAYRAVFSESDDLPGLIVDRFMDTLSVQIFSAGMEHALPLITEALCRVFSPRLIVLRNESSLRTLEGLPQYKKMILGTEEEAKAGVTIRDSGIEYHVNLWDGHKSGFFLDQRENRKLIRRISTGKRVLDVFCSDGGFALNAAYAGAASVLAVDRSMDALRRTEHNATLNSLQAISTLQGDAFEILDGLVKEGREFDVVILDPPALTKSKKQLASAIEGYRRLNRLGLRLTRPGGFFATSSCSYHLSLFLFMEMLQGAARDVMNEDPTFPKLRLLQVSGQSPDHPIHPFMPETQYLKFALFSKGD